MLDFAEVRSRLPAFLTEPDPMIYSHSSNYVVLDFETSANIDGTTGPQALFDENFLVLACWWSPQFGSKHVWGGEYDMAELIKDCQEADFIVAHNAKFELQWLNRCGLDMADVVIYDTMIAEYVIGGNRYQHRQLSLNSAAERRLKDHKLDVMSAMYKAGMCSSDIPESWLYRYCLKDVALCARVMTEQLKIMQDRGLLSVFYTRCLATPVLAAMEHYGMCLDSDVVTAMKIAKEAEYNRVQLELAQMTGGINVNSTLQLRKYLYETLAFNEVKDHRGREIRTLSGLRKTDAATIDRLRPECKMQREFLSLFKKSKELYNELTKYLRKFSDCCEVSGGFMQAEFNQCNTRTHRLSSTGLLYKTQFQNFKREYKPMFKAREDGWLIGEADGAQLEFRVAAHLGRDEVALSDIINGTDIHAVTAGVIGCSRQDAKAHTFKPLYGGKSGTPAQVEYYEYFSEKYKGIANTQQQWINTVLQDKELVTEWGMRYYWPDTEMQRSGYITNSTAICNYPVQAFATAEIIPVALVFFWHYLQRTDLRMLLVNTVHDSIISELPPEEVKEFHELSKICFIDEVYEYLRTMYDVDLTVPLATGVVTGDRWGSSKDETVYTKELV